MKRFKQILCGCLCAAFAVTALTIAPVHTQAASAKLSQSKATLKVGQKITLTVQNAKKNATIKWSSNDKTVAAVSSKGVVSAKAVGKATIQAVVNKKTLKCKITVKAGADANKNDTGNAQDVSAKLAGKSYVGTAKTSIGDINVLNITFSKNGKASGTKMNETTMQLEKFSGTYQAFKTGKNLKLTIKSGSDESVYDFKIEKNDYSKLSTQIAMGELKIKVTLVQAK